MDMAYNLDWWHDMKRALCIFILPILLLSLSSCGIDERAIIEMKDALITLKNENILVLLDSNTGRFVSLKNLKNGKTYDTNGKGPFLFIISAGVNANVVTPGTKSNTPSRIEFGGANGEKTIEITYGNLSYDYNGAPTGISVTVILSIAPGQEYFKIAYDVSIDNGGEEIERLSFVAGGGFAGTGGEMLTAPMWGGGTVWDIPFENQSFKDGVRLGYPGKDDHTLESCYIDLYSPDGSGGLGLAYINSPQMLINVQTGTGDGFYFTPVLFDPKPVYNHSVPLEPGSAFHSGDFVIAPHSGDWHQMADLYRTEFNAAFTANDGAHDYLEPKDLDPQLLNRDMIIFYAAGWDGKLQNTFAQMYDKTVANLSLCMPGGSVDGSTTVVWIAGQNEKGYAFDVPVMVPCYPDAGGEAALKELDSNLHEIGCAVVHYEHPFAVDPDGKGYISSSDPMQHTETWDLCTHHSVCIDNDAVFNLWKDKILPDITLLDVDGIQFDQCSLQQTVCDLSGHRHGLDAVSRLTSHIMAINKLCKYVRVNTGFILSEGSNDMLTRFVDIRQTAWYRQQLFGGVHNTSMRQYTFPQFINQYDAVFYSPEKGGPINSADAVLRCATMGGVLTTYTGFDIPLFTEYNRFRGRIRAARAPGFPFGFKDNVGLTAPVGVTAFAFVEGSSVTVTYYTIGSPAEGPIVVDFEKLGIKGKKSTELNVSLGANSAGFTVIK